MLRSRALLSAARSREKQALSDAMEDIRAARVKVGVVIDAGDFYNTREKAAVEAIDRAIAQLVHDMRRIRL